MKQKDTEKALKEAFMKLALEHPIRGLLCFEPEKIVLRLKRGTLTVEGENLSIGRYAEGDLLILGDIRKFEVESL